MCNASQSKTQCHFIFNFMLNTGTICVQWTVKKETYEDIFIKSKHYNSNMHNETNIIAMMKDDKAIVKCVRCTL